MKLRFLLFCAAAASILGAAGRPAATLRGAGVEYDISASGAVQAFLTQDGKRLTLDDSAPADEVWTGASRVDDFRTAGTRTRGGRFETVQRSASTGLEKTIAVQVQDGLALWTFSLRNAGKSNVSVHKLVLARHRLNASLAAASAPPFQFWSWHGASVKWGQDEVAPLAPGFVRPNILGSPVGEGEGGGLPVVALWTRDMGIAFGHLETAPRVLSLPVRVADDGRAEISAVLEPKITLKPGESYSAPRFFLLAYRGDYYEPLRAYSQALQKQGWKPPRPGREAYAPAWCGWGFSFNVTSALMTGAIPKLKELGFDWATLDDRWFQNYGDWEPRLDTFPGRGVQSMVQEFHKQGIKTQLWWYPLVAEDGMGKYPSHQYVLSQVVRDHPDWLILNADGSHAKMFRDLAGLCPAVPEVREYHRKLVQKFLRDWDFDGLKLDVIYSVPPCYNPKHHHKSPEDSIAAIGEAYHDIYYASLAVKPESVTQICPCGTTPNVGWLPYQNQAVAADPNGSVQVRRRIKMYKALLGSSFPVYGDHVEYTGQGWSGSDFASTIGLGGVPGSRFTWPGYGPNKNVFLTQEKSDLYKRWLALYKAKSLSSGDFRNLYVLGYDAPEGYAIEKGGTMYYAFFAPGVVRWQTSGTWQGELELRGLKPGKYRITDYVNGKDFGILDASSPKLKVSFEKSLLLEATRLR
jgi:alpha-galactosidase